ncbi:MULTISPECIES: type IX secretion system membrane protein PorP/SprF [Roseivirga]|jgi:type IX secretion system PorP/SprF family membrane protein|uniref:Membrane protein n=1 Tax=Roseivirga thermotolerans TaxID=1758176 RepID=A0ABQ3I6H8_9BACT|nr:MULTISPECIES: type IX secretion system membrane protein PorP/SprF [Roseivirga]MEC7752828.1 type IX secretion system membrane protein PorP/SprF [Bacteroidota bacterium]GHE54255.1 membrane protein [Roseivirga thermotolerans]|tara:strand:+ start:2145 stop:3113 length:969 start_codon:yes stop_codon:yes gene_type:complete
MSRKAFIAIVFSLLVVGLRAQQDAQFTQYMFNPMYYNSAFTGLSNANTLTAIHRSQWFGYEGTINPGGAPNTQFISYSTLSQWWNGGLGVHLVNDNLGPSNNIEFKLSGSYYIALQGDASLSIGLNAGFFSSGLDFDELVLVDPSDDLVGLTGKESQLRPDLGMGILYRKGNFFGGFSTNHLLQPKFDFGQDQIANQLIRHYYLTAGYDYALSPEVTITPTLLLKSVGFDSYSWDLSVVGRYNDQLWAGVAYRQSESASVMIGYSILKDRSLALGYALDLVLADRNSKEPTSQEIMLIYKFSSKGNGINLGRNIIRTPRYRY